MLYIHDTENISTKPSSPSHSIHGEVVPLKDGFHFQDCFDPMTTKFEIEYKKIEIIKLSS